MAPKNKIVQVGKNTQGDPASSGELRTKILKAAMSDKRLGARDYRVLLCLLSYADPKGLCWPSMPEIGEKTNTTDLRFVRRSVSKLEQYGYLTKNRGVGRRKQGNVYRVRIPESRVVSTPLKTRPSGVAADLLKQGSFYPGELLQREVRSRERSRSRETGSKRTKIPMLEVGHGGAGSDDPIWFKVTPETIELAVNSADANWLKINGEWWALLDEDAAEVAGMPAAKGVH